MSHPPGFVLQQVGVVYPNSHENHLQGIVVNNLHIPGNGVTAIIGASGCGKSTLLRLLAGFAAPSSSIKTSNSRFEYWDHKGNSFNLLDGKTSLPAGELGFVFQEAYLLKTAPVAVNIGVGMIGAGKPVTSVAIAELLKQVGLPEDYDLRRGRALSGGEAQRVAFCRAFSGDPQFILVDEPTSSLDHDLAEQLMGKLHSWAKQQHRAVVWVTHDVQLAAQFADQVIVLAQGRPAIGCTWPQPFAYAPIGWSVTNLRRGSLKNKIRLRRGNLKNKIKHSIDKQSRLKLVADWRVEWLRSWLGKANDEEPLTQDLLTRVLTVLTLPCNSGTANINNPKIGINSKVTGERKPATVANNLGFSLRLAFSELFGHPRVDACGPAAAVPVWSGYRKANKIVTSNIFGVLKRLFSAFSHINLAFITLLSHHSLFQTNKKTITLKC